MTEGRAIFETVKARGETILGPRCGGDKQRIPQLIFLMFLFWHFRLEVLYLSDKKSTSVFVGKYNICSVGYN